MSIGGSDFSVEGRIEINLIARGMDAAARSLAGIAAQSEKAAASLRKVAAGFDAVGQKSRAIGQGLAIGVTAPILGVTALAVNAASDLAEAGSAVSTVFGAAGKDVLAFAETTDTALGLSKEAALSAATELGALFTGVGLGQSAAADFSKSILGASADLASFYNVAGGAEQVLQDIRSGLIGEAEPLRKYGILLSEAAVQEELARQGQADLTGEQLEAAKVSARYAIIMRSMGAAQGDFARTSDGLANQTRIMRAELTNAAAEIGAILLPIVLKAVRGLSAMLDVFRALPAGVKTTILIIAGIAAAIGPAMIAFGVFASAIGTLVGAFAFLISPIGLVLAAIAALAIVFRGPLGRAISFVVKVFKPFAKYLRDVFIAGEGVRKNMKAIPGPLRDVMVQVGYVVDALGDLWRAFNQGGMAGFWEQLTVGGEADQIKRGLAGIVDEFLNLAANIPWGRIATALGIALATAVIAAVPSVLSALGTLATAIGDTVEGAIDAIPWGDIVSGFGDLAGVLWTTIEIAFNSVDWAGLWELAESGISAAAGTAIEVGRILLVGDVEIEDRGGNVEDTGRSFAALVADAVRSSGILLQAAGAFAMRALAIGIGAAIGAVAALVFNAVVLLFAVVIGAARDPGRAAQIANALLNPIAAAFGTVDWAALVGDLLGTIVGVFEAGTKDAIVESGAVLVSGFIIGVAYRWEHLVHFLGDLLRALPDVFAAAPSYLFNAGYNLITGLINGIAARWNDLTHYLADLASHLPDWITGPLGIHSPSTVFMAIGADTAAGFGVGFRDAWRHVESSLATGARSLATTVVIPPAPRFAPAMAGARTVQAGGVTINVNGAGDPNAVADRVYRSLDAAFGRLELESRR